MDKSFDHNETAKFFDLIQTGDNIDSLPDSVKYLFDSYLKLSYAELKPTPELTKVKDLIESARNKVLEALLKTTILFDSIPAEIRSKADQILNGKEILLDTPLADFFKASSTKELALKTRIVNRLKANGVTTLRGLKDMFRKDIKFDRNLGKASLEFIERHLDEYDLSLK